MDSVRTLARRSVEARAIRPLGGWPVAGGGSPLDILSPSIHAGFWEWNASADSFWLSPRARIVLRLDPKARLTRKTLLAAIHPADRGRVLQAIDAAAAATDPVDLQLRLAAREHEVRWIEAQARTHRDTGGTVRKMSGHVIDITDAKRAAAELLALRQQVNHLARVSTLSEFSGALVHELQQPLTSIRCNALAARRLLGANAANARELGEIFKDVLAGEARAQDIMQRMRSLLKRRRPPFARVEIGALAQNVAALAGSTLRERGIELTVRIDAQAPAVRGDLVELEQVLLNLLLNASQSMNANAPADRWIELDAALDRSAGEVRFSVRDAGTGIDPQHLERIFEPYFSTRDSGLGMGLAICRAIVRAHKGRIWAVNNAVRGASFHFTVPIMGET